MNVLDFIREKFREYYLDNAEKIKAPTQLEKREFGFIPFRKEKIMIRHRGFENKKKLIDFLKTFVPSDAYYSSAYYQKPSEEKMVEKGWIGADLIFDVDCDHIQTLCKRKHDRWICLNCGKIFDFEVEKCLDCGSEKIDEEKWVCEECLTAAKNEVLKLVKIFEEDFGIDEKHMQIVFSGHRGYHVHLEHKMFNQFGVDERKEIVDYITGAGLNLKIYSLRKKYSVGLDVSKTGWSGRLARALYDLTLKKPEELVGIGLKEKTIKKIGEKREQLLNLFSSTIDGKDVVKLVGKNVWRELLEKAFEVASIPIDTVVTTDIHRLIRLPNTLHGKTGFRVIPLTVNSLYDFNPLNDALTFNQDEKIRVKIKNAQKIKIDGVDYGPYKEEILSLPVSVAMFYICRGKATPI